MTCTRENAENLALGTRDLRDIVEDVVIEPTWERLLRELIPSGHQALLMTEELERVLNRHRLVVISIDALPEYDEEELDGDD